MSTGHMAFSGAVSMFGCLDYEDTTRALTALADCFPTAGVRDLPYMLTGGAYIAATDERGGVWVEKYNWLGTEPEAVDSRGNRYWFTPQPKP